MSNLYSDTQKELNKNKMKYPQKFIDKCLSIYPNDKEIKTLLDDNSFLLGFELKKRSERVISSDEVLKAKEKGTIDKLKKRADIINNTKELYLEFVNLYEKQYLSKGLFIHNGLVCSGPKVTIDYKIRHGFIEKAFDIDPIVQQKIDEGTRRVLEENETRRIKGQRIAGEYRCR